MANSAGACHAWDCDTGIDNGCKSCVALASRLSDSTCEQCNAGHYEKEGMCAPFGCAKAEDSDCMTCVDQSNRTSNKHCSAGASL